MKYFKVPFVLLNPNLIYQEGLCILGEACPLSHETENPSSDESGVRNGMSSNVENGALQGQVTNLSMKSHPNDQWMSESHSDESRLDQTW